MVLAGRRTEESTRRGGGPGPGVVVPTCKDCSQCLLTATASGTRSPPVVSGSVANRSVSHPTRLETRTKESNMCASHGVLRNLKAQ